MRRAQQSLPGLGILMDQLALALAQHLAHQIQGLDQHIYQNCAQYRCRRFLDSDDDDSLGNDSPTTSKLLAVESMFSQADGGDGGDGGGDDTTE